MSLIHLSPLSRPLPGGVCDLHPSCARHCFRGGASVAAPAAPKIDHILLEVSNLNASIAFYRDFLGLRLKSESDWFVMLESNNVGVFLRNSRWDWEKPQR